MSGLNVVFDFAGNFIATQEDFLQLPTTSFGPRSPMSTPPTSYTTGSGGTYQLRPDLSRNGFQIVAGSYAPFVLPVVGSIVIADAMVGDYQSYVVSSLPEHEQRGAWHTYSSMLTGTFGIGSGLKL